MSPGGACMEPTPPGVGSPGQWAGQLQGQHLGPTGGSDLQPPPVYTAPE